MSTDTSTPDPDAYSPADRPVAEPRTATPRRVSNTEAQRAILHWMGSYEGFSGSTLADLIDDGVDDATLVRDGDDGSGAAPGEGIPADIVAGYRLALKQTLAANREEAIAHAVAEYMRANPKANRIAVEKATRRAVPAQA